MAAGDEKQRVGEILRLWAETDYEVQMRQELVERRSAINEVRRNMSPEQAQNVANWARYYPGISNPMAIGAGLAGVDPVSDTGRELASRDFAFGQTFDAEARLARDAKSGKVARTGWQRFSDRVGTERAAQLAEMSVAAASDPEFLRIMEESMSQEGQEGPLWKAALRNTFGLFESLEHEGIRRPWRAFIGGVQDAVDIANREESGPMELVRFFQEAPGLIGVGGNLTQGVINEVTGRADFTETVQSGVIGRVGKHWTEAGDSALAMAIEQGQLGEGAFGPADAILPRGPFTNEMRARLQQQELAGVQNPTVGRVTAQGLDVFFGARPNRAEGWEGGVMPQGSLAHNIVSGTFDFARAIYADPTAAALGLVGDAASARKFLVPAGARPTVGTRSADSFLNSAAGRHVVGRLAETTDVTDLRRILRTNNTQVLRNVADADTPDAVYDVLYGVLGRDVRAAPRVLDLSGRVIPDVVRDTRMGRFMERQGSLRPDWAVDIENPNRGFDTLDNFMRLTRMTREQRRSILDEWTRVPAGDYTEAGNVVVRMLNEFRTTLLDEGWSETTANRLSRIWTQGFEDTAELRRFFATESAEWHPFVRLDANGNPTATPHLIGEFLNRAIPLPDPQQVRRALSPIRRTIEKMPEGARSLFYVRGDPLAANWGYALSHPIIENVWKPLQLLRLAIIPRIALEEQGRLTAEGLDSVFQHPLSYIMWATGKRGKGGIMGDELSEAADFQMAMQRAAGGWLRQDARDAFSRQLAGDFVGATKGDPNYGYGWAIEMKQLANDPVAQHIANNGVDATKAWLWDGDGRPVLDRLIRQAEAEDLNVGPEVTGAYVESVFARMHYVAGGRFQRRLFGQNRDATGRFVALSPEERVLTAQQSQEILRRNPSEIARMHYEITQPGSDDIWQAFRTGTFRMTDRSGRTRNFRLTGTNAARERRLGGFLQDISERGPDTVKRPRFMLDEGGRENAWSIVTNWLFESLMSKPTNYLSRSPAFRQLYWRRVEELAPYMSREARTMAASAARVSRLEPDQIRRIADAPSAKLRPGETPMELGDVDQLTKGYALEATRDLLFDMTRRRNFFDATRLVFPFGDAWAEVLTAWGGLASRNPQLLRRGQQAFQGARQSGFFQPDPTTGLEMFMVPGADLFGSTVLGVDPEESRARIRFGGFVEGLNLALSPAPGVGPLISIPAAGLDWLNHPDRLWLRNLVLPFGGKPVDEPADIFDVVAPAWMKRVATAVQAGDEYEGLYESASIDVLRAMGPNGLVDFNDRDATLRLADKGANAMSWIRFLATFAAPTGVTPRIEVRDDKGRWWALQTLLDDWRETLERYEFDELAATTDFMDKYGIDPLDIIQPKTQAVAPHAVTREGAQWETEHAELFDRYPAMAHYLNPAADEGEFDVEVWGVRYDEGQRQRYTAEQWLEMSARLRAQMMLAGAEQTARERGVDQNTRNAYMRDVRTDVQNRLGLSGRFYTWEPLPGLPQKYDRQDKVEQALVAAEDPDVTSMPAGEALALYVDARERARQAYVSQLGDEGAAPDGVFTATKGAPMRAWLRDYASALLDAYPEFGPMYRSIFAPEVIEEPPPEEETPVPEPFTPASETTEETP